MTLITEMMERPLDPGYAAAAERRQGSGLSAASGQRSPLLITVAILIGVLLSVSALALRAPTTANSKIKVSLVSRIETARAHDDAQTRVIASLRQQINKAQSEALSLQNQSGLTAELARLELAAGTVPATGPGLVLTIDDAESKAEPVAPDANPQNVTGPDQGKVLAKDLQIIVNGLWDAGAEAISINGHRLTSRAAIRSAGAAILVDYRPLTRPYVISAIGDRGNLAVEFADNSGGSYLQSLTSNYKIRADIQSRKTVVVPGEPALSVLSARPVNSAVTNTTTTTPQQTESSP
jgi:uncharacterized protein YlxW (UPF0749 family)